MGFTGDMAAIAPLIDLLYRKDDGVQVAALDALLYLDRGTVEESLLDALKQRGARERMVHFLVVSIATQQALAALTPLVQDTNTSVSKQATIAVGWIAQASAIGSDTRKDAITVLRKAAESPRRRVSEQARTWLMSVGAR